MRIGENILLVKISTYGNLWIIVMKSCSQTPPSRRERVWYTSSAFWGAQDAAYHVIDMTTHRFGMEMHQPLSRVQYCIVGNFGEH